MPNDFPTTLPEPAKGAKKVAPGTAIASNSGITSLAAAGLDRLQQRVVAAQQAGRDVPAAADVTADELVPGTAQARDPDPLGRG